MKSIKEILLEHLYEGADHLALDVTFWNEKDASEYAKDFKGLRTGKQVSFPVRNLKRATDLLNQFPKHIYKSANLPD